MSGKQRSAPSRVVLVFGVDHREFGVIVCGLERCPKLYPDPASWRDRALVIDRDFARG